MFCFGDVCGNALVWIKKIDDLQKNLTCTMESKLTLFKRYSIKIQSIKHFFFLFGIVVQIQRINPDLYHCKLIDFDPKSLSCYSVWCFVLVKCIRRYLSL